MTLTALVQSVGMAALRAITNGEPWSVYETANRAGTYCRPANLSGSNEQDALVATVMADGSVELHHGAESLIQPFYSVGGRGHARRGSLIFRGD